MKKALALSSSTIAYLTFASSAFAQSLCPSDATFKGLCGVDAGTVIGSLINFLFVISIVVALFYLIWGGFKWLTSGGDKTAVQSAREHVVAAIVGLVVIFLAYFILGFLVKFFIPNFDITKFTIPKFGQ